MSDHGELAWVELVGEAAPDTAAAVRAGQPVAWWPPMGLTVVDGPGSDGEPTLNVVVDVDSAVSCDRAESDLGLFAAEWLDGLIAVHAAVIRADGVVIVVPGPSFVGKTTLCVAALDAGWEVLSDEYALVDPDTALVRGWPRRLRVREPGGGATRVAVAGDPQPVTVDLVAVVTKPQPIDAPGPALDVTDLTGGELATALLSNTVCARSRPELAFAAAVGLARAVPGVGGTRGQAPQALAELVDLARRLQT